MSEEQNVDVEESIAEIAGTDEVAVTEDAEQASVEEANAETSEPAAELTSKEVALDNEGEISADYLEELLDIADLDGDIDTYVESDRAHVSILTDSNVLVGAQGEVLEALQELSRLVVMTETGHRSRLMLDIGGYREKRRKELQDLAADAIAETRTSGEQIPLPPMNPFERKIVHDAVAAAGLRSESEGADTQRHVVIYPVSDADVSLDNDSVQSNSSKTVDQDIDQVDVELATEAGE